MNKGIISTVFVFLSSIVCGQSPDKMSYQAVIRDAAGKLVVNSNIGIRITILQGAEAGTAVYEEVQFPATNANGLVTLQIGTGESDNQFSEISWQHGPYFLKSEIDPAGGQNYTISGTTQLLSVPYALYATTAENVITEKQTIADVLRNMNSARSQIKDVVKPTDPLDAVNKEYVTIRISITGDTLFMGNDQYVVIPNLSSSNVKAPAVVTLDHEEPTPTSSILFGCITSNGWDKITEYGFIYSLHEGFENSTGIKVSADLKDFEKGEYSVEIDSLEEYTTYYYKAFASNNTGTSFGEENSFSTLGILSLNPVSTKISDVIGSGYDITAGYANSNDLKSSVLDYQRMLSDSIIHQDLNQVSGSIMAASGSTTSSYQSSMKVSANIKSKYGCFSGEIRANFDSDRLESSAYAFATQSSRQILSAFCIDKEVRFDNTLLHKYIKQVFLDDIDRLSAGQIIAKYGTDVILGGMWGGRADFNMSAKKSATSDGKNIGAYASAKYKSVLVDASGSVDVDSKYNSDFQTETTNWKIVTRGGDPSGVTGQEDFLSWQQSINDDNQVFIDYYNNCVVPISEFIADPVKKLAFEQARDSYIMDRGIAVDEPTIQKTITHPFELKGFTQNVKGDSEVNSQSGRNTFVATTITLEKTNATTIKCTLYLYVEEEHSDHTTFSGTTSFDITTDKEILDFPMKKYTVPKQAVSGLHHDYVDFMKSVHCDWIAALSIRFDSSGSNDRPYIGLKGTLNFNVQLRGTY